MLPTEQWFRTTTTKSITTPHTEWRPSLSLVLFPLLFASVNLACCNSVISILHFVQFSICDDVQTYRGFLVYTLPWEQDDIVHYNTLAGKVSNGQVLPPKF